MAQVIKSEGYPHEMQALSIRELFSTKWLFNYRPWGYLQAEVAAQLDQEP